VGGGEPGISGQIGLLDLNSEQLGSVQVAQDLIYAVDVRNNKAVLACTDGSVRMLLLPNLTSGEVVCRHTAAVTVVRFSNSGLWLASGALDGLAILSSPTNEIKPILLQNHTAEVECLTFSPDNRFLASGARDGKVRIHAVSHRKRPTIKTSSVRLVRTYTSLGLEKRY